MSGIWTNRGDGWELGSAQGFQDEAALHRLIAENPRLLPLAGSPRLTVLGSEVQLGNGSADILAVESSGRPAIIEVKLASNPEARRNIVAQVLAYAAFLRGSDVESLEHGPLHRPLAKAGHGSILEAVQAQDEEWAVEADSFTTSLNAHLDQGRFRLVLVLDEVSAGLERVVAYLDAITVQAITIDLITLNVYDVNGTQVALPQRVSPDLSATIARTASDGPRPPAAKPVLSDGPDAFRASIEGTSGETRTMFDELIVWAERLSSLPNVRLFSNSSIDQFTLVPKVMPDNTGLVTIWNNKQQPYISVFRTVFERLAPNSIEPVEQVIAPITIGQGNTVKKITSEVLDTLTAAYREATTGD